MGKKASRNLELMYFHVFPTSPWLKQVICPSAKLMEWGNLVLWRCWREQGMESCGKIIHFYRSRIKNISHNLRRKYSAQKTWVLNLIAWYIWDPNTALVAFYLTLDHVTAFVSLITSGLHSEKKDFRTKIKEKTDYTSVSKEWQNAPSATIILNMLLNLLEICMPEKIK